MLLPQRYEAISFGGHNAGSFYLCVDYKVWALLFTSFQEALFIDEDAFFIRNPDVVFKSKEASQYGAIFWHDISKIDPDVPIWGMLKTKPHRGYSQESGVVYIDKKRHWQPLALAGYLNQRRRFTYSVLLWDKDTFFISFNALKHKYAFVPYVPVWIGRLNEYNVNAFKGYSFVQPFFDGLPLFLHLVSGKKTLVGMLDSPARLFEVMWVYDQDCASVPDIDSVVPKLKMKKCYKNLLPYYDAIGDLEDVLRLYRRDSF